MKKPRRVSAAVAVGSLLAGAGAIAVGLIGAGAAGAAPVSVSKTFTYSCDLYLLGATDFEVTVSAKVPDSVVAGDPIHLDNFQTTVVTPANVVGALSAFFHVANVEGHADVTNVITDNGVTQPPITFTATVDKTAVPTSGTLTTVANATVPDYVTTAAGSVVLASGPFTVKLHGTTADNTDAGVDDTALTFTCTPPSDATLATVTVTEPAPTTSSSTPTDTSSPTTPGGGPTTSPGTEHTTGSSSGHSPAGEITNSPISGHSTNSGAVAVDASATPSANASLAGSDNNLANTGAPSGLLLGLGALLVASGVAALLISRRWSGRHTA